MSGVDDVQSADRGKLDQTQPYTNWWNEPVDFLRVWGGTKSTDTLTFAKAARGGDYTFSPPLTDKWFCWYPMLKNLSNPEFGEAETEQM